MRGRCMAGNETNLNLTDAQRLDWLRLFRSDNVGPRGIMAQTPPGFGDDPDGKTIP